MTTQFEAFENLVKSLHDHPTNGGKRYGQVYFKILSEVRPDIAEHITGTMFDPFYKDELHDKIRDKVRTMWEQGCEAPE
jgi:hypothetical protein